MRQRVGHVNSSMRNAVCPSRLNTVQIPQQCRNSLSIEETTMPFTYRASASPSGNDNVRRVCTNSKCGGTFYISYGAQNYRCPHCDFAQ
jgi:hypothetical protein